MCMTSFFQNRKKSFCGCNYGMLPFGQKLLPAAYKNWFRYSVGEM